MSCAAVLARPPGHPTPRSAARGSRAAWLTVLLGVAGALAGCGSSGSKAPAPDRPRAEVPQVSFASAESDLPAAYPPPPRGRLRVGYLNPDSAPEGLRAIQEGFEHQVRASGGTVTALDAGFSVDRQVSQFQTLIDQGVDAIGIYPIDPGAVAPLVARAGRAGIPVVGLEATARPGRAPGFASQVWLAPDRTAYQIAHAIAVDSPGATVATIGLGAPVPYITEIVQRIAFWGGRLGLTVVASADNKDDTIAGATTAATGLLGRHPDLDAIATYSDDAALGAYAAVRSAGRGRRVRVYGNNGTTQGLAAVRDQRIAATFQFDALGAGALTATAALDAAAGIRIPPVTTIPPPEEIDRANVASARTWKQQLADGG